MRGAFKLVIVVAALAACSCSVTRRVSEGGYLLRDNTIIPDGKAPRKERIKASDMERFIRQTPNKKLLRTDFYLWTYNMAKPEKNNGWNRMLRRIGEEPVILDTVLAQRSAQNIKNYMNSRGFLNSEATYDVETNKKKAYVTYHTHQGAPYRIGNVRYDFRDKFVAPVIMQDSSSTLIEPGNVLDFQMLDQERIRIVENLKNRGYYNFNINNIYYIADTTVGNHMADLTMVVRQFQRGYNDQGEAEYENNSVYRIRDISIQTDYDAARAAMDTLYISEMDTIPYRGLEIVYRNRPRIRPEVLRRSVPLYPGYLYSAEDVKRTYDNIMRLGYFKSVNITFSGVAADTTSQNMITFIGDGEQESVSETTTEQYLDVRILCAPALRQSYKIQLEGSTTSSFYSLTATLGYQNRNLFRGAELFDISVMGGYEFMRTKGSKTSFEVGGNTSITFPRFVAPFRLDRYNRINNAKTRLELSINSQKRPYYHRTLSSAVVGYSWSSRGNSTFTLRPIDVSLVKMGYIDSTFKANIENPYLENSYNSQLIAGISGGYVYNNQRANVEKNSFVLRVNWETTGNTISALTSLFGQGSQDYAKVFGIRYSQYFRMDASLSNKFVFGPRTSLVTHLYGGFGLSYGNSNSIPFDRLFYSGGNNSMRGWQARTLGPGNALRPENDIYPRQLGNMKLEANLEARFPVWGFLNGAVFFDLGNIWFIRAADGKPEEVFRFDKFYKQLALNSGIGARFDFSFFLVRLDWGIQLHDPNLPPGQRWIDRFRFSNTALTFGVGYPF